MKLNIKAFGVASGILAAIWMAWIVALAMMGRGMAAFEVLNHIYLGLLSPTLPGLALGILIAFVDGAVAAMFFAWLYNRFAARTSV